jgi:hypothetical protein
MIVSPRLGMSGRPPGAILTKRLGACEKIVHTQPADYQLVDSSQPRGGPLLVCRAVFRRVPPAAYSICSRAAAALLSRGCKPTEGVADESQAAQRRHKLCPKFVSPLRAREHIPSHNRGFTPTAKLFRRCAAQSCPQGDRPSTSSGQAIRQHCWTQRVPQPAVAPGTRRPPRQ